MRRRDQRYLKNQGCSAVETQNEMLRESGKGSRVLDTTEWFQAMRIKKPLNQSETLLHFVLSAAESHLTRVSISSIKCWCLRKGALESGLGSARHSPRIVRWFSVEVRVQQVIPSNSKSVRAEKS